MQIGDSGPQASFQERLQRLGAVDAEEPWVQPTTGDARMIRPAADETRRIPKVFFLAIVIGAALVLIGNLVHFANSGLSQGYFAQVARAIGPLPITGLLAFVLMIGLGFRDKPHVAGLAIGMPAMYFGEPFLAHLMPQLWAQMYSAPHVDAMLVGVGLPPHFLLPG